MPHLEQSKARIFYQVDGPSGAPALVLSNSLGTQLDMWEPQLKVLSRQFTLIRYDNRGHGRSDAPPGPCDLATLGGDVVALLDALDFDAASFCGLSLGGLVGMWLAANAPTRIDRLVLANTSAYMGAAGDWDARIDAVRRAGMAALAAGTIERWFTPEFRLAAPAAVERIRRMLLACPVEGYAACCAAIRDMDQRATLTGITAPTLLICGARDPATPPAQSRFIAERIGGSRLLELNCAHLSNVEAAAEFTVAVADFLRST